MRTALLLAIVLGVTGCIFDDDEPGRGTGGSGGTAGSGGSAGSGGTAACSSAADCALSADACKTPACEDGVCGWQFQPEGTPLEGPAGDCRDRVCDGAGNESDVPNDADFTDDGQECTVEACDGGTFVQTVKEPGTLCLGGYCHADGGCYPCEPDPTCENDGPGEPNDTQDQAHDFGTIDDCDGSGGVICGSLSSESDVDWFTYYGTDDFFCDVEPERFLGITPDAMICKYWSCTNGTPYTSCPGGATPDTSPLGHPGCCAIGALEMEDPCSPSNDVEARIWIKVQHQAPTACAPYSASYHY